LRLSAIFQRMPGADGCAEQRNERPAFCEDAGKQ
jgi:hypothetical protein